MFFLLQATFYEQIKSIVRHSRVDFRNYFFCNRVIKIWNSVPATTEDFARIGLHKFKP